jgi:hypothetical protein
MPACESKVAAGTTGAQQLRHAPRRYSMRNLDSITALARIRAVVPLTPNGDIEWN